jgi:secondary thiamine-phosphate synthase enzyme
VGVKTGVGLGVGEWVGVGSALGLGEALEENRAQPATRLASRRTSARANGSRGGMPRASYPPRAERAARASARLGPMESREVTVTTAGRRGVHDLTATCAAFVDEVAAGADGLLHVFAPHATAGVVIMELGSGSDDDLLESLDRLLPRDDRWRHRHGSPGHGADHVLPLLVAPSISVPVLGGRLALGTWQSIALVDPNRDQGRRRVRVSFLPA